MNMKGFARTVAGAIAVFGVGSVWAADVPPTIFDPGSTILFQGDSITDGLHKGDMNHVYGHSFVWKIAANYQALRPELDLQFGNRGNGGDTSSNLVQRWSTDAFPYAITENGYAGSLGFGKGTKMMPDYVSILIGINDYFHFINHDVRGVSCPDYARNLRTLVAESKKANPGVKIILCEPFRIPNDASPEFCRRQAAVADLAAEFDMTFVPFQKLFSEELLKINPREKYWFWDFFHPTPAGHCKMADFWIDTVRRSFARRKRNTALEPRGQLEKDSYDWYERHERVVTGQAKADPEIVFIGDSITHGWEHDDKLRGDVRSCFTKWFGKYRTLNMGFGWDRIQNVLWRLSHGELDGTKPRIVVINIGTNNLMPGQRTKFAANTPEEIADGIVEVCRRVREKAPHARIVLMDVFPRDAKEAPHRASVRAINAALAPRVEKLADANLVRLDLWYRYVGPNGTIPKTLMFDGLHPTVKGYDIWAEALKPIVEAEIDRPVTNMSERLYRAGVWVTSVDSLWGFRRHHVNFRGMDGWIVEPKTPRGNGEWVWCMKWPGAFREGTGQVDALERGYHYVYLENRLWMNEEGTKVAKAWRDFLVKDLGFAPKVNLIGMSWGGFYSTRYAANYPDDVARIYYDCPLLSFDGFPIETSYWGGAAKAWWREAGHDWSSDPLMPVNLADRIAATGIPILLLYGGADTVVSPAKNSELFIERYKAAGGKSMQVVCRPKNKHHPHGFTDAADKGRIVDFFEGRSSACASNVVVRRTVAFLGGSITEMNGFRPRLMTLLRAQYPDVVFTEIAAGLSSTCSDTAAFRLRRDVLEKGVPDLLIVDEAVNDDQDGNFDLRHCIRGMEGVIRGVLLTNPRCRVVIAQMVNRHQFEQLSKGEVPVPYAAGRLVAARYGAVIADVGTALVDSAGSGGIGWKEYRDCHPSPAGCDFAAQVVQKAIGDAIDLRETPSPRSIPEALDDLSYFNGHELELRTDCAGSGWTVMRPDWAAVPGSKRGYFTVGDVLCGTQTNGLLTIAFSGSALAALLTAGPDAGDLSVSIDGGPFVKQPLRACYGSLHYPYTHFLADDLSSGRHVAHVRIVPAVRGERIGTVVRINRLYSNGGADRLKRPGPLD